MRHDTAKILQGGLYYSLVFCVLVTENETALWKRGKNGTNTPDCRIILKARDRSAAVPPSIPNLSCQGFQDTYRHTYEEEREENLYLDYFFDGFFPDC